MKNYLFYLSSLLGCIILFLNCNSKANTHNNPEPEKPSAFAKGADVGWLQQMEATGFIFKDSNNKPSDCLDILKNKGFNSLRFRLFYKPSSDPQSGHCSTQEVAQMCLRAKEKGFRIMLNFHYSDSWADPAKQNLPTAWKNHDLSQLKTAVYDYTKHVLDTLKSIGITPEWVQIGNEIPGGMLWPLGKIVNNNFAPLAQLLNSGSKAVKDVDSNIKVIIHIDKGNDATLSQWFFAGIKNHNVQYDVIGLSYYPYWLDPAGHKDYKPSLEQLKTNITDLPQRFGKPVMIVETGGEADKYNNDVYQMLGDLLTTAQSSDALGVFYWEPEAPRTWSKGYALGCWGDDGKPLQALDAFQ